MKLLWGMLGVLAAGQPPSFRPGTHQVGFVGVVVGIWMSK